MPCHKKIEEKYIASNVESKSRNGINARSEKKNA
jgi:hypothetical protein